MQLNVLSFNLAMATVALAIAFTPWEHMLACPPGESEAQDVWAQTSTRK